MDGGEFRYSNDDTGSYSINVDTGVGTTSSNFTANTSDYIATSSTHEWYSDSGQYYKMNVPDTITVSLDDEHKELIQSTVRPMKFLELVGILIDKYFDFRLYSESFVTTFTEMLNTNLQELGKTFFPDCRFEMKYDDDLLYKALTKRSSITIDMIFNDEGNDITVRFDTADNITTFRELGVR